MVTSFDPGSTEQMSTNEPTMDYGYSTVSETDNSTYSSDLSSMDDTTSLTSDTDTSSLSTISAEIASIFIDTEPPTTPVNELSNSTDNTTLGPASEMTDSNTIATDDGFTTTIEEDSSSNPPSYISTAITALTPSSSDSSSTSFNTADTIFPDSSVTYTDISTISIIPTSYPIVSS